MIATNAGGFGWDGDDDTQPENQDVDTAAAPGADEVEQIEPRYADVFDWVDGFFSRVVRRKMNAQDGRGLAWDARWWAYPEVFARLTALHEAWEGARASTDPMAMSAWWVQHLEPHLRVIFDGETGPMSHANGAGSHPRLANAPAPDMIRELVLRDDR